MRRRDESGAVALLVGMLALVLFGTAALSVDLAQLYVARETSQHTVDSAVLAAGGSGLPAPNPPSTICFYGRRANATDPAVVKAAAYLTAEGAFGSGDPGAPSIAPASLVDCNLGNGEVGYGTFHGSGDATRLTYDPTELSAVSPPRSIRYGFAQLFGSRGGTVATRASVQVSSPTIRSLPLYAYSGCDYGGQTIAQPANGHASTGIQLAHPEDTNDAVLGSLVTDPATDPAVIPQGATAGEDSLTIKGSGLGPVTKVGFFESGLSGPGPDPVTVDVTDTAVSTHSPTEIALSHLPQLVLGVNEVWYVRVKIGDSWSPATRTQGNNETLVALPLTVGTPTLTCGQGSSAGNFGTLLLPNTSAGAPNGQTDNIAYNIATNIQHSLAIYPGAHSDWLCNAADPAARLWSNDGTNCVTTEPGLDLHAAQEGLLDGVADKRGRLTDVSDGTGCAADGKPSTTVLAGQTVNNDTLSCFLTQDDVTLSDIEGSTYSFDHPVLSPAIYDSPRFALVPVLGVQPDGGRKTYQIVDIRPAFITDQPMSATRNTPASAANGLTFAAQPADTLGSVQVIFFNAAALPPPPNADGVVPYTGTGVKVTHLID